MSKKPATANEPSTNSAPSASKKPAGLLPPEEKFWQRYSQHHELPLSTLGSVTLHALVGVFLVVVVAHYLARSHDKEPLPIEAITIDGGGGGDVGGVGDGPGTG